MCTVGDAPTQNKLTTYRQALTATGIVGKNGGGAAEYDLPHHLGIRSTP